MRSMESSDRLIAAFTKEARKNTIVNGKMTLVPNASSYKGERIRFGGPFTPTIAPFTVNTPAALGLR